MSLCTKERAPEWFSQTPSWTSLITYSASGLSRQRRYRSEKPLLYNIPCIRMNLADLTFSFLASTRFVGKVPSSRYLVIGVIHELLTSMGFISSSVWLGEYFTLICWLIASSEEANFAKMSTSVFWSRRIWTRMTSSNQHMIFLTRLRYLAILFSFALYSSLTCPTTNCELLWTLSVVALSTLAICRPVSRASYSAHGGLSHGVCRRLAVVIASGGWAHAGFSHGGYGFRIEEWTVKKENKWTLLLIASATATPITPFSKVT